MESVILGPPKLKELEPDVELKLNGFSLFCFVIPNAKDETPLLSIFVTGAIFSDSPSVSPPK